VKIYPHNIALLSRPTLDIIHQEEKTMSKTFMANAQNVSKENGISSMRQIWCLGRLSTEVACHPARQTQTGITLPMSIAVIM
jgi:hypothetical protein